MKRVICLVALSSSILIHSMEENREKKSAPKTSPHYIFVNVVTFLCPDQKKIEQTIGTALKTQTSFFSLLSLGACYLSQDLNILIKDNLFAMLKDVSISTSLKSHSSTKLYVDDQRLTPAPFCDFCTAPTDEEANNIYEQIKEHFKKQPNPFQIVSTNTEGWFSNMISKSYDSLIACPDTKFILLLEALDLIFNNKRRNTILELCPTLFQILQEGCENGAHKIILTANMSHSCCYDLLKMNNLDKFFKEINTSDKIGYVTAQKEFYEACLKKHAIDPEQCIVIDDHKENLMGAEDLGMKTIHKYKNEQFHKELKIMLSLKKQSENQ